MISFMISVVPPKHHRTLAGRKLNLRAAIILGCSGPPYELEGMARDTCPRGRRSRSVAARVLTWRGIERHTMRLRDSPQ